MNRDAAGAGRRKNQDSSGESGSSHGSDSHSGESDSDASSASSRSSRSGASRGGSKPRGHKISRASAAYRTGRSSERNTGKAHANAGRNRSVSVQRDTGKRKSAAGTRKSRKSSARRGKNSSQSSSELERNGSGGSRDAHYGRSGSAQNMQTSGPAPGSLDAAFKPEWRPQGGYAQSAANTMGAQGLLAANGYVSSGGNLVPAPSDFWSDVAGFGGSQPPRLNTQSAAGVHAPRSTTSFPSDGVHIAQVAPHRDDFERGEAHEQSRRRKRDGSASRRSASRKSRKGGTGRSDEFSNKAVSGQEGPPHAGGNFAGGAGAGVLGANGGVEREPLITTFGPPPKMSLEKPGELVPAAGYEANPVDPRIGAFCEPYTQVKTLNMSLPEDDG